MHEPTLLDTARPASSVPPLSVVVRPLAVLGGDHEIRPAGLERELLRAGFHVAEIDSPDQLPGRASVILHLTGRLSSEQMAQALAQYSQARMAGAQVMVLIDQGEPDDLIRAAEAGADDAVLLPADPNILLARVRARLAAPRTARHAPDSRDHKLFDVLQAVAVELNRDEMLHALVNSLAQRLEVRSVTCLLHHSGGSSARLAAASDAPKIRDMDVELDRWPEAMAAHNTGSTVYLRDVATSPLFLAVAPRVAGGGPAADLESTAAIPMQSLGRAFGTLVLRTRRGEPPLSQAQIAFAELAVAATSRLIDTDDRRGAIARRQALASHVDPLTGCGTLDALDRRIREEFERSRRYEVTFAVVLLDVDGMRSLNDRIGRDGGHRVLADLGRLLQRELRGPDFVARYGGEEFLLLLPETDLEGGRRAVHRIREQLNQSGPADLPAGLRCHLTAGVAVYPHPAIHKPEDLFAMVESALLAGKAQDVDRIGSAA